LMKTWKKLSEERLTLTRVLTPRLNETPAPVEPAFRAFADLSNI
jgi:hypothetical protein